MDPPPPSTTPTPPPTTTTTTAPTTYPDSVDSSPRSRATDYDDPFPTTTPKLRLMCSYGGHIVPRPHDKSLCYVGGDTRMVVVDRASTLPDLISRLSKTLLNGRNFTLKYQLPNEDLDSLITLSSEEDLDNMIDEYDRLLSSGSSGKSSRIRLFLFPSKPEPAQSIGSLLDGSNRSEDWFLNALNGAAELQRGFSDPTGVNSLLGLDANGNLGNNFNNSELGSNHGNSGGGVGVVAVTSKEMEMMVNHGSEKSEKLGNQNSNNQSNPDIQSVPDSPIIETTSSFGSTSSSPSLANMPPNLPPIRVHVEEGGTVGARVMDQRGVGGGGSGIEEQFAQMGVNVQKQQLDDQGYLVNSSPSTGVPASMISGGLVMGPGGGEYVNRTVSDDERSDHGGRKQQQQMGQPMMVMTSQPQQKHASGSDLPSPDSVSSDSSFSNTMSRPKQVIYQDPNAQLSSGNNRLPHNMIDPNTRMQMQQVSESGYVLPPQYDQQQLQLLQHQQQQHQQQQHQHQQQLMQQQHQQQQHHQQHQQQQHHQQQQQAQHQQQQAQHQQQQAQHQHQQQQAQTTQTQPQAQQYIPAGTHYMHHPHPSAVPMQAYYSVYPPQQSHHHPHQYPVYYVPAGQAPQGYSLPVQQQQQPPNLGEPAISNPSVRPQTPPNPTVIAPSSVYNPQNVAPPKPEMNSGVYRTIPSAGPQLIQVPSNQPPQSQPQPPPQSQPQPQPPPPSQSQPQPPQHQPQPQQQQQFMGYSQIHHPSQSIAPGSTAGGGNYAYEFADPARSQIYFTQPLAPTLSAHYNQGIASGPAMVLPDGSQIPNENVKQQIRSSQPL